MPSERGDFQPKPNTWDAMAFSRDLQDGEEEAKRMVHAGEAQAKYEFFPNGNLKSVTVYKDGKIIFLKDVSNSYEKKH